MDPSLIIAVVSLGFIVVALAIARYTWSRFSRMQFDHGEIVRKLNQELILRERAERRSQRWGLEMQALLDNAVHGIATLDAEGGIHSINRAACELFGYTIEEVVGKKISFILPSIQEVRAGPSGTMYFCDATLRKLETRWELKGRKKDGSEVPVEFSVKLILIDDVPMCSAGIYDLSERYQSQKKLQESLKEKEVLLKEIHHRVKNNLQVISSIFSLQQRRTTDPRVSSLLEQSQNRVQSIALLHETLYRSQNLSRIDMADYLKKLLNHHLCSSAANKDIVGSVETHGIFLHIDKAIPCGLIINELLTNTLRHAYPPSVERDHKTVEVELVSTEPSMFTLKVHDNGVGMPSWLENEQNGASLGLRLVKTLCLQLHGSMNIEAEQGTKFELSFHE